MLIKETSDMTASERRTIHNQNNSYLETGIQKVLADGYNIDELKFNGKFAILNATGTLPSGYTADDNNFFIECYMWLEHYGRQVLHDVRTNRTFSRNLFNDEWQPFEFIDYIVESGTTDIWTWEKWNSGKAVCWGIFDVYYQDVNKLTTTVDFPFEIIGDIFAQVTKIAGADAYNTLYATTCYEATSTQIIIALCNSGVEFGESDTLKLSVYVIGKWK